jgi:hypothetical protein
MLIGNLSLIVVEFQRHLSLNRIKYTKIIYKLRKTNLVKKLLKTIGEYQIEAI